MEIFSLSIGLLAGLFFSRNKRVSSDNHTLSLEYDSELTKLFDKPSYLSSRHDYVALCILPKIYPHLVRYLKEDTHKIKMRSKQSILSTMKKGGIGELPKTGKLNVSKMFFDKGNNSGLNSVIEMPISEFNVLKKKILYRYDLHLGGIIFMMQDLNLKPGFSAPEVYTKFYNKYSLDISNSFDSLKISVIINRFLRMTRYFTDVEDFNISNNKLFFSTSS